MTFTQYTDARGNSLELVRQIPAWSMFLEVANKDGTRVEVELTGEVLGELAEALSAAAATQQRLGKRKA